MSRNLFTIKNKDVYYGENCVESIYGNMANYATNAITSKGIISWGITLYPIQYRIDIQPSTNSIIFRYVSGDNLVYTSSILALTGNTMPGGYYCKTSNYTISLSWKELDIRINKGLQQDNNLQSFILSWASFTGSIDFYQFSTTTSEPRKIIGTISVDTRTQIIQRRICLSLDTWGNCLERNK